MGTNCIVKGCCNRTDQGDFMGNLCMPCYNMLSTGELGFGNTFVHDLLDKKTYHSKEKKSQQMTEKNHSKFEKEIFKLSGLDKLVIISLELTMMTCSQAIATITFYVDADSNAVVTRTFKFPLCKKKENIDVERFFYH